MKGSRRPAVPLTAKEAEYFNGIAIYYTEDGKVLRDKAGSEGWSLHWANLGPSVSCPGSWSKDDEAAAASNKRWWIDPSGKPIAWLEWDDDAL